MEKNYKHLHQETGRIEELKKRKKRKAGEKENRISGESDNTRTGERENRRT